MRRREADGDDYREERDKILRRASRLALGFWAAAVAIAVLGSAFAAWFLTRAGLPFRETWLTITVIVLVVPLIGVGVGAVRRRREDRRR